MSRVSSYCITRTPKVKVVEARGLEPLRVAPVKRCSLFGALLIQK